MNSRIHTGRLFAVFCGIGLAAGMFAFRAQADEWNKKTTLTVNQTIQVQDTVLPAGTYTFKLLDSPSDRHIVEIFNQDQTHLINTILAIPNYRLQPTGRSRFLFYETPPGAAPALRAWFYPGDNFGQEFRYPKHLAMLETTAVKTESSRMIEQATKPVEAPPPPPATAETAPAPAPEPAPAPPTEMAQNTPPPAPAPAETPAEAPKELPKTASPYPLIGFAGLLALSMSGLLRLRRRA